MRASLIRHVDPWRDADRGARYEGVLAADRLPRLAAIAALCAPLQVSVSFQRAGEAEKHGAVEIVLQVDGRIELACQRCLGPMTVETALQASVWVARDESAARAVEALGDAIVAAPGERLDLAATVEDEVLLSLPFAPRHQPGVCMAEQFEQACGEGEPGQGKNDGDKHGSGGAGRGAGHGGAGEIARCVDDEVASEKGGDGRANPFAALAVLRGNANDKN